ncbi:glycoside hydrolase [Irpex rosettiformis]|uniref:Glycoside hydrolase n=1 Tax=Irpex rosettiformis TaxID=378272 RepID=A0ACB8UDW4_9APHY|nr:glycoside hydrolase [Irpex rosettiformis]
MLSRILLCLLSLAHVAFAQHVFAHWMLAEAYSFTQNDWENDISSARSIGIDGFALNMNANDYEASRLVDAYAAAATFSNPDFKLFISFDMSYSWSVSGMVSIVTAHADSPAQYEWNDKVLVSTYSGDTGSYGNVDFWSGFKSNLANQGVSISLAPAFTTYRDPNLASKLLSTYPSIDGFMNWWSWPNDILANLTTDTDVAYQKAISQRTGPYIMGVSPWWYKDLSADQNWGLSTQIRSRIICGSKPVHLVVFEYMSLVQVKPDIVEIITWSGCGESHYIADLNPNINIGNATYVDGQDHAPWRKVAQYYNSWYKTGTQPTITNPKSAVCAGGITSAPRNANFPADEVFALTMVTSDAMITLDISSSHSEFTAHSNQVSMGSVPFPVEDSQIPYIQIPRNSVKVKDGYGSIFVEKTCTEYNFNPFVGIVV